MTHEPERWPNPAGTAIFVELTASLMTRSLPFLFVGLLLHVKLSAQCTVPVPNDAIAMLETDSSTSFIQQSVFICSGVYVSASSVDPVIFLESGAHMNFSGFSKNIYAKAGSIVDGSGIDDTIYYEVGAQILIGGINQTLIVCDPLTFDFGPTGSNPCEVQSGLRTDVPHQFGLYPTHTSDVVHIIRSGPQAPGEVRIIDLWGRTITSTPVSAATTAIDVSHYATGAYIAIATAGNTQWTGRFIKD